MNSYIPKINTELLKLKDVTPAAIFHDLQIKIKYYKTQSAIDIESYIDDLATLEDRKSYHHKEGNNRGRLRKKIEAIFANSPLFKKKFNKWIAVSERKLCRRVGRRARYIYPAETDLVSLKAFKTFLIGATALLYKHPGFKKLAKANKCSVGSAYNAIQKQVEAGRITKFNNMLIHGMYDDYESACIIRESMFDLDEYKKFKFTNSIKKIGTKYYLLLYLQNSYSDATSNGHKQHLALCDILKIKHNSIEVESFTRKKDCKYQFVLKHKNMNLYKWKDSERTLNDYLKLHITKQVKKSA